MVGRRVLSLGSLVEVLLGRGDTQKAAFSFCEDVISQKEAERLRREKAAAPRAPRGGRRGGFRGRGRNPLRPPRGEHVGRHLRAHLRPLSPV
jgi:hypothetical protein